MCIVRFAKSTFEDDGTCIYPDPPAIECYQTSTFNEITCEWELTGTQPVEPTVACYETTTFNEVTCEWEVSGTPPEVDDNCDLTTDSFDPITCEAINMPNCPDDTFFNASTCECESGEVPGCIDPCAINYDPNANIDDGSCEFPDPPTIECYQTSTFNGVSCEWEITGTQPVEPVVECYQTTTFNDATCEWEISGEQPEPPATECYQTATFNNVLCEWELTGTQPVEPTVECYQTTTFNDITCEWEINGEQPEAIGLDLGLDIEIEFCESVQLSAQVNPLSGNDFTFAWSPAEGLSCTDCAEPVAIPFQTTTYTVVATDMITGCSDSDMVTVTVDDNRSVFIPNVFSPNYDGANDVFIVYGNKGVAQINSMRIYDRWGEMVFENTDLQPDDPEQGWDGMFRDQPMNPGVFVYVIEVLFVDGKTSQYSGDVTLVK